MVVVVVGWEGDFFGGQAGASACARREVSGARADDAKELDWWIAAWCDGRVVLSWAGGGGDCAAAAAGRQVQ